MHRLSAVPLAFPGRLRGPSPSELPGSSADLYKSEAGERRAAFGAFPGRGDGQRRPLTLPIVETPHRFGCAAQPFDLQSQLFAGRRARSCGVRFAKACCGDEAVPKRGAELKEREDPAQFSLVPSAQRRLRRVYGGRQVTHKRRRHGIAAHGRLSGNQGLAQAWCEVVQVSVDGLEIAVGVDQLRCRLLPHAGHPGQVVRRVAA